MGENPPVRQNADAFWTRAKRRSPEGVISAHKAEIINPSLTAKPKKPRPKPGFFRFGDYGVGDYPPGETVAELEQAFREAVDDYLSTCADQEQTPEVPCKGSYNVRVGHDLHLAASVAATRQRITLNDLTRRALSDYLEHHT